MPSKEELEKMFDEYNSLFDKNGYSEKSVGWNKPKHNKRFKIALDEWEFLKDDSSISVLDIGCGLGHLYEYLVKNNFKWQYKGIDLNKKLIKNANKIHNCELFFEDDIDSIEINKNFDLIFIIGTFNRKFNDSKLQLQSLLTKSFKISNLGVHLSLLAPWALKKYDSNFYPSLKLLEECMDRKYVSSMNLKSDVILGEMSINYFKNQ